jgi:hypothetical protein
VDWQHNQAGDQFRFRAARTQRAERASISGFFFRISCKCAARLRATSRYNSGCGCNYGNRRTARIMLLFVTGGPFGEFPWPSFSGRHIGPLHP